MIHISLKSYQVVFLASLSYAKLINNEKIFFIYLTKNIEFYAFDLSLTSFGLFVLAVTGFYA